MKLTKSKLKQLIREELENASLTLEMFDTGSAEGDEAGNCAAKGGTWDEAKGQCVFEEAFDVENPKPAFTAVDPWWLKLTDDFLKKIQNVYRQAPDEGKEYMTKNFEMYAQKWREEQQASVEE